MASNQKGCHFGIIGMFGILGIFGIMLLPPEFARGRIGPEGVCEAYEGRGVEEKVFLQNEPNSSFRINKNGGFVIGFDWPKKPPESHTKPFIEDYAIAFRAVCQQV